MLEVLSPITEAHTFNNFTMKEKTPVVKINLRGNPNNKDFSSKVGKILGIILPSETGHVATKEKITVLSLGPNEWLIVSNDIITTDSNSYELEQVLFDSISKSNLGAVTNVGDQFTVFSLTGNNIFEVLSKACPFDFDTLSDYKAIQTILNHVDIIIYKKNKDNVDLYVRRSFSNHLWDWLKDSANLI